MYGLFRVLLRVEDTEFAKQLVYCILYCTVRYFSLVHCFEFLCLFFCKYSIWFSYLLFPFPLISRFLGFVCSHITILKTFFNGRPWAQKRQCLKICAQSEARMQVGLWTSPLKVSSKGLFPPVLWFFARTYFARFICFSPRLSARLSALGSPRMISWRGFASNQIQNRYLVIAQNNEMRVNNWWNCQSYEESKAKYCFRSHHLQKPVVPHTQFFLNFASIKIFI